MLQRMDSQEITEWMAFSILEPFGSEAYYLGHAIVAQTVANVNRKKQEKIDKFMPKFKVANKNVEEMVQYAQAITIALGGEDKRNG